MNNEIGKFIAISGAIAAEQEIRKELYGSKHGGGRQSTCLNQKKRKKKTKIQKASRKKNRRK